MSTQPITISQGALPRLLAGRWAPLPVVLSGTFMVVLDFFIVNVALPSIQSGLHSSSSAIEWVLAGYGLTSAVFLITGGRLSRGGGAPLLDPSLFAERTFTAGLLAQLVFWSGQASFFLVLALYLQQGRGLSALNAGLVYTILAVAYLVASLGAPGLATKHGRRVLAVGALMLAAGHSLLLATVAVVGIGGQVALLAPGLILVGAGMGLGITPLATIILASVEPHQAGAASGALMTMQNVGNAIGVAVIGVIFFGAVHSGFAGAFELSLAALAAILVSVAVLTRLLPAPARS